MTMKKTEEAARRAVDICKSIHLSASAGSGKTRALKDRYLALLDALSRVELNLDQAAAITFTDKAAAEIKERVMSGLPEAMLKKIIRGKQDLRISTIHSFCMNLLKRYPLEAGLPPDFGVLDTSDRASKIEQAIEDAIETADRSPGIMNPLRHYPVDSLIDAIRFMLSIRSRLQRMEIDAGGRDNLLRVLRRGMRIDALSEDLIIVPASAEWRHSFENMEAILRHQPLAYQECLAREHLVLAVTPDVTSALRIARALTPIYFNKDKSLSKRPYITKKTFVGKEWSDYEKAFFTVQGLLERFAGIHQRLCAGSEAVGMLGLYLIAEDNYQESKLREGLLDFDDLEIFAYRLLQNMASQDILYWLDRKILHFLVDEFQDTSDIQWAILDRLTSEIFAGQGAEKRLQPTLFVVGDVKQSIYRFREANYRLMESVRLKMETLPVTSREILTLDRNFRSSPEIVAIVNTVFTGLWGAAYAPSEAERSGHYGTVRLLQVRPAPVVLSEADMLARELLALVRKKTIVYERVTGTAPSSPGMQWIERPALFSDCAILIQSRTKLKEYEAALQRENIPYRVVGGIGFYEEEEVQAFMNVLFFLWNRDDTLSLAGALKSALFGLTDQDLQNLRQDGGSMVDALHKQQPETGKLLGNWQLIAGLVPLTVLLHTIISDTGAYVRFGRRSAQALFNIDKLLDTSREFDRRGYTSLQDFVEWARNNRRTEQREAAADMNLPGAGGSVSILTVHKAKGLEYPIVFLPGMNQAARSLTAGPEALVSEAGKTVHLAIKSSGNPVYEELWAGEQGEQAELLREHQRLLYVAMTRARDHLVMIGALRDGTKPVAKNTWLDFLYRVMPQLEATTQSEAAVVQQAWPEWQPETAIVELPEEPESADFVQAVGDIDGNALLKQLSPLPRSETLEWKRATDFIVKDNTASETLPAQSNVRTIFPLIRGQVLHRCLDLYAKTGFYEINRIMRGFPEFSSLGEAELRAFEQNTEALLKAVITSSETAWLFDHSTKSYSELPFLYRKGHAIISGVIDRVVLKDGAAFVIDYKSIMLGQESVLKAMNDHYRPQIQIYCEAISEIFKIRSIQGYLLYLDSNRLEQVV